MNYFKEKIVVLINKWAYFQPAGDSGMNKRNAGNIGISCGNNGSRTNVSSNFQHPIISCLNDIKDQKNQHQPSQNHNYNNMLHSQNQQQVIYSYFKYYAFI